MNSPNDHNYNQHHFAIVPLRRILTTTTTTRQSSSTATTVGAASSLCHTYRPRLFGWMIHRQPRTQCDWEGKEDSEQQHRQRDHDDQCAVCMYTGMAVCTGLSLYFLKLATEESALSKNRRFLYTCSAGWAVAGVYRWYLGPI